MSDCFLCGQNGHRSRDCPDNVNQLLTTTNPPFAQPSASGRRTNHSEQTDALINVGGGTEQVVERNCYKCNQPGHFARDCPQREETRSRAPPPICHRCHTRGHIGRDCTADNQEQPRAEASQGRRGEERGSGDRPGRVTYVPPADRIPTDETELFNTEINCGINFAKHAEISINISGRQCVQGIKTWGLVDLDPHVMVNIKQMHYETPTPIQQAAIPNILVGRDVMGCAQTGSGKTAAYLIPVISMILRNGYAAGSVSGVQEPVALILVPTRELAIQIEREACKFSYRTTVSCVCVYGGVSVAYQMEQLNNSNSPILVATPGRLKQFVHDGRISLRRLKFFILDEADRMLDGGFEPELRALVQNTNMPRKMDRQTLMFSATFPPEIQSLAKDFLDEYVTVVIGQLGSASRDIRQEFHQITQNKKAVLKKLLEADMLSCPEEGEPTKTLVFVERKRNADFLASLLSQDNIKCITIHGDRDQSQREEALSIFRSGKDVRILIATAVAARGLNIPNVDHVINYDLPQTIEEYVHRIGRTGRLGNVGRATSFFDPNVDEGLAFQLVENLKVCNQVVPEWLASVARISAFRGIDLDDSGLVATMTRGTQRGF